MEEPIECPNDNLFWKAVGYVIYSGGQLDLQQCKPSISPSNIAQNANPGTVLKTARPVDSKTPPKCSNWLSFDWDIWDQRQMIWF